MRILAVDPGKATGIAVLDWFTPLETEPRLVLSQECQMREFAPVIREVLSNSLLSESTELVIVCERFVINAATVRNTQAPYSLEMIGVLKQIMLDYNLDPDALILQSPADAKSIFPNPALKKLGYWHKGDDGHANDAIRHALLRAVKLGWKPRRLLE
jgi:hypothetical protein